MNGYGYVNSHRNGFVTGGESENDRRSPGRDRGRSQGDFSTLFSEESSLPDPTALRRFEVDEEAHAGELNSLVDRCEPRDMRELVRLYQDNRWNPRENELSLTRAEEHGTLKKLMCVFQFPFERYPAMADRMWRLAKHWIKGHSNQKEQMSRERLGLSEDHPSPEASVLANFLRVKGQASVNLMTEIVDEMAVFTSQPGQSVSMQKDLEPIVVTRTLGGKIQRSNLGPVYLNKEVSPGDIQGGGVIFDRKMQILSLEGDSYKTIPELKDAGKLELNSKERREEFMRYGDYLSTSPLYPNMVKEDEAERAMIPRGTVYYAFVLPGGERMTQGGFVYLDKDYKLLAVNALDWKSRRRTACFFSEAGPIDAHTTELMRQRVFEFPLVLEDTEEEMMSCCWIGSNEKLGNGSGNVQPKIVRKGGFAFFFNDPKKNCFFEMKGFGVVVDRGSLHTLWGRTAMNVSLLPPGRTGEEIQSSVAHARWSGVGPQHRTVPVSISRIAVPGVLHPLVLHALAESTSDDLLRTDAAKAIAFAGYKRSYPYVATQLCAQAVALCSLLWFARMCRAVRTGGNADWSFLDGPVYHHLAYLGLGLRVCINLVTSIKRLITYRQWHWTRFFFSKGRILCLVCMLCEWPMLYDLAPRAGRKERHWHPHHLTLKLIAFHGAATWVRVLWILSGLEALNLGTRILPIGKTLMHIFSFLFIMVFFFGAAFTVAYSLTTLRMSEIWISTYQMAFAGEYDDSFLSLDEHHGGEWAFRFGIYCFFGILIMVALNNIFIGIMSNTFDHYEEKAIRLFVRQRATFALDYCMLAGLADQESYLWFCSDATADREKKMKDFSLRNCISGNIGHRLDEVVKQLAEMEGKVNSVYQDVHNGRFHSKSSLSSGFFGF